MNNELFGFVKEALGKGIPREKIQEKLATAGWRSEEIKSALDAFFDTDFPVPVPRRAPYLSAREAFMYLLMFLTLYTSSAAFGTLLFQFINRTFPDPLRSFDSSLSVIRGAAASLIIAFPVFMLMSWLLGKAIARDPDKQASKIRKWLTYITLFIAAGIIIGDLITLINTFLGGELTLRFVLKVLTVLLIAGTIFGYYLSDMRGEELRVEALKSKNKPRSGAGRFKQRVFAVAVSAAALAALVAGLILSGSPEKERSRQFDNQRTSELQQISYAIDTYYNYESALPADLGVLIGRRDVYVNAITDPRTGEPYAYSVTDGDSYELCATFETDSSPDVGKLSPARPVMEGERSDSFWRHGVGRTCYTIDVRKDPTRFPPKF